MKKNKPTLIDLFCGCGGFSLGAHRAGFETAVAVDVDKTLTSSFLKNYPKSKLLNIDLAEASSSDLLKVLDTTSIDGLIGGPPCQGFSEIGKRRKDDPRNKLVWHFFRHVASIRPKFFVMENVPGMLFDESEPVLREAMTQIPSDYEIVGPIELDASEFGAATKRSRVILIGYDKNRCGPITAEAITLNKRPAATVQDAISDLPPPPNSAPSWNDFEWLSYKQTPAISHYAIEARTLPPAGTGSSDAIEKLKQDLTSGFQPTVHSNAVRERLGKVQAGSIDKISKFPRLAWGGQCTTLRAGTGPDKGSFQSVRPIHPDEPRVITVREAARIQGFPDWFLFHPTKWHSFRMIGNSVSPYMSAGFMKAIAAALG